MGGGFYTIDHGLAPAPPSVGTVVYAQAWVRAISSTSIPQSTAITLRTFADSNYDALDEIEGASITLSTTWQLVTTTLSPTKTSNFGWNYYVGTSELNGSVNSGDCFLIDDVVISQTH